MKDRNGTPIKVGDRVLIYGDIPGTLIYYERGVVGILRDDGQVGGGPRKSWLTSITSIELSSTEKDPFKIFAKEIKAIMENE